MFNTGRNSISTRQKLQVYNNLQRLKEEEELLKAEMKQYIVTFKDIIPNELHASIQSTYTYKPNCYNHIIMRF